MITVILVHYATPDILAQTLAALATPFKDNLAEVIVVDNASLGPIGRVMQDLFPGTQFILNQDNIGFGRAANQAARGASGDSLLFLNGDSFLKPIQLLEIEQVAARLDEVGAIGFRQISETGMVQLTFGRFPTLRSELERNRWQRALDINGAPWATQKIESFGEDPFQVDWVSGSCLWIKKAVYEKINGFDEQFFMYYEDIDLCCRVRELDLKVYHSANPRILHGHGASALKNPEVARAAYRNSQLYFAQKHKGPLTAFVIHGYQFIRQIFKG